MFDLAYSLLLYKKIQTFSYRTENFLIVLNLKHSKTKYEKVW